MIEPEERAGLESRMEKLRVEAEAAYDQMYEVHSHREAHWQFELAYDWLREAVEIARSLGLEERAAAMEKRAEHIRKVYRHQFMNPPDLSS